MRTTPRTPFKTLTFWLAALALLTFGLPVASAQGTGTITGRVFRTDGVTPITSGIWITLLTTSTSAWVSSASVTGNGTYQINSVPAGTYKIAAYGDGYAMEHWPEQGPYYFNAGTFDVNAGATTTNINFTLAPGGTITGRVTDAATGAPLPNIVAEVKDTALGVCTNANGEFNIRWVPVNTQYIVHAGGPNNWCGGSVDYAIEWWQETAILDEADYISLPGGSPTLNLNFTLHSSQAQTEIIRNGSFANGMQYWGTWDAITHRVSADVMEFYRNSGGASAVVMQNSDTPIWYDETVEATFDLGNSSHVRKRVVVLLHDQDWSEVQACMFWLAPYAPMRTYRMKTKSMEFEGWGWESAVISFYASPADSIGWTRLDNVSVRRLPGVLPSQTLCTDPTAPATGSGANGADMVRNGNFNDYINGWTPWGQIGGWLNNGVFEFYRTSGGESAVMVQSTGAAVAANSPIEARFKLGNTSSVRKRVMVLLHDGDWSDSLLCSFMIDAAQPLREYVMRGFTTEAWSNVNIGVYANPGDGIGFIRLDDVSVRRRPAMAVTGTSCYHPGNAPAGLTANEIEAIDFRFDPASLTGSELLMPTLIPTATAFPPDGTANLPTLEAPFEIDLATLPVPTEIVPPEGEGK